MIDALAAALSDIRAAGTAVLMADEGLALTRRLADRILLFEDGRVTTVAREDPRLGVAYLSGKDPGASGG